MLSTSKTYQIKAKGEKRPVSTKTNWQITQHRTQISNMSECFPEIIQNSSMSISCPADPASSILSQVLNNTALKGSPTEKDFLDLLYNIVKSDFAQLSLWAVLDTNMFLTTSKAPELPLPTLPPNVVRKHKHPCRPASYLGAHRLLIFLHIETLIHGSDCIPLSRKMHTETSENIMLPFLIIFLRIIVMLL